MKTALFSLLTLLLVAPQLLAQENDSTIIPLKRGAISKGTLEWQGHRYACDIVEYDAPPDVVSKAIEDAMKSWGHKPEKKKGVLVYRNVRLSKVKNQGNVDAFIVVEEKNKNEVDKSKVSLLFTEPGEIGDKKGTGKTGAAVATIGLGAVGVTFIDQMNNDVSMKHHQSNIDAQTQKVAKTENEIKKLESNLMDNQKKLEKLQKEIAENQKDLENARQKLLEGNKNLEQLRARKQVGKE